MYDNEQIKYTMNTKGMIVSLEGNIGSGKSTLMRYLTQQYEGKKHIVFLQEPVDEWSEVKDENDVTILEKFYADQKKYAFSFQMMAYISRLALLKKTRDENPDAIIVTERSLYTDRYVFAKMLYETRDIEEVNYKIYLKWFDCFVKDYPIDKVIYVNTPPPTCLTRIIQRSRNAEVSMPISYLNKCHLYHERMIEGIYKDNTLVLDGSNDFNDIKRVWLKQVIDYITTE